MQILQQYTGFAGLSLTGFSFLFVTLPLFVIAYRLTPERRRAELLLGLSLLFYALACPSGLPVLLVSVAVDYGLLLWMSRRWDNPRIRRWALWLSGMKSAAVVILGCLRTGGGSGVFLLGGLVFALSGTAALAEMGRGEARPEAGVVRFGLYCCFFPRLYAGPYCSYGDFSRQLDEPVHPAGWTAGFSQYLIGAFKTGVLGGQLAGLYRELRSFEESQVTVLSSWLLLLTFALSLFYLLAGFSDMAQGLGTLFGLRLPKNFYYPYQSRNVTDFFERFQITVVGLIRHFLGNRAGRGRGWDIACLLAQGAFLGLWFGLEVNCLLWGLYMALFAVLEKYVYPKVVRAVPVFVGRICALCVTLSGFTILSGDSLARSLGYIRGMLGFIGGSMPLFNDRLLYLLAANWLLLVAGAFFAVNLLDIAGRWLRKAIPAANRVFSAITAAVALVLYVALSL